MATVLHLVKSPEVTLVLTSIHHQVAAGDGVTVALLHGAPVPAVPAGVRLLRVPEQLSHDGLLDLIFASDHVVTW